MKRPLLICRLLASLLIAGLVMAPLTVPVPASVDDSASMAMASTSEGMPCCPDKWAPMDCDKCPLMAICAFKTFQAVSTAGIVQILPTTVRTLIPVSDPEAESLGYPPPPRPPRSLV